MKKVLIIMSIILLGALSCFAGTYPRWQNMPIRVYIPEYGQYTVLMQKAFNAWQVKSGNLVRFKYVSRQSDADVYVGFVNHVTSCNDGNAVGCTVSTKRNGLFLQNYIEIATKETYMRASSSGKIQKVQKNRSAEHVYGVMLHEAGHALGLEHSNNPNSIMYPIDRNEMQYLTKTDMALLIKKYR